MGGEHIENSREKRVERRLSSVHGDDPENEKSETELGFFPIIIYIYPYLNVALGAICD